MFKIGEKAIFNDDMEVTIISASQSHFDWEHIIYVVKSLEDDEEFDAEDFELKKIPEKKIYKIGDRVVYLKRTQWGEGIVKKVKTESILVHFEYMNEEQWVHYSNIVMKNKYFNLGVFKRLFKENKWIGF